MVLEEDEEGRPGKGLPDRFRLEAMVWRLAAFGRDGSSRHFNGAEAPCDEDPGSSTLERSWPFEVKAAGPVSWGFIFCAVIQRSMISSTP